MRQLESEITTAMYYPSLTSEEQPWNTSFWHWYEGIENRLDKWSQTTRQNVNLSQKIEFHELLIQCQVLRMTRPSPRCPNPTKEMRRKNFQSSIALIKEFNNIDRTGKFFMLWHATFFILEAGVCLLASICTEMEISYQDTKQLGGEDTGMLMRYITTFPPLLWKVARRWPSVARHATALDAISLLVLEKLQRWTRGELVPHTDISSMKQTLSKFTRFSPVPSEAQAPNETGTASVRANPTSGGDVFPQDISRGANLPEPLVTAAEMSYIASDWTSSQMDLNSDSSLLPDSYDYNDATLFSCDFSGIASEDILAALLDDREILMLDNGVSSS